MKKELRDFCMTDDSSSFTTTPIAAINLQSHHSSLVRRRRAPVDTFAKLFCPRRKEDGVLLKVENTQLEKPQAKKTLAH